jgi:hypothetical protein
MIPDVVCLLAAIVFMSLACATTEFTGLTVFFAFLSFASCIFLFATFQVSESQLPEKCIDIMVVSNQNETKDVAIVGDVLYNVSERHKVLLNDPSKYCLLVKEWQSDSKFFSRPGFGKTTEYRVIPRSSLE